jgi:SulP family sulfate permease
MNEGPRHNPETQLRVCVPEVHKPSSRRRRRWLVTRGLFRLVPAVGALLGYTLATFRFDFFAGLTVAAVAVPQAMAYATIAGLPPAYGLYTAIVMTAVGALLDSSRQLINGPTNAISIAVLSAVAMVADPKEKIAAVILLAFLIGCVLKNLLGLPAQGGPHDHFLTRFWLTMLRVHETNGWTLGTGLGTILVVLGLRMLSRALGVRLPEFLLAVVAMAGLVWWGSLDQKGVQVVGAIPPELPGFALPSVEWVKVRDLAGSALTIALLGLLEAIAMTKAIAAQTGQKLDINQQCLSEGLANLTGSFFQCMPGSGSLTRSAINQQAGGQTQWSGVISAVAVALTVLLFGPFAHYIPRAALSGILFLLAWRLVDRKQLAHYLRTTRFDACIVLATAVSAVAVSVEFCILIGVFGSFLLYVPRAARIQARELVVGQDRIMRERQTDDPECSRLVVLDLVGEFFFGAAPDLNANLASLTSRADAGSPSAVHARKVRVLLCGVRPDLARALRSLKFHRWLPPDCVFHEEAAAALSTLAAVRRAYELLGDDLCDSCPRRGDATPGRETWHYMI